MKLLTKFVVLAILGFTLIPNAAYAAKHDNETSAQSDDSGGNFDNDDDDGRKKPKFQTKFFGD